ncbi:restriction endonuclease subunit S [Saccharospirillum alexandrii]|uniref:restriction endonuclease subunit S n=1 Tax=Saccharospirillum alexandrii TaxID=2448477 RepID=UPI001C708B2B|nr:restriction endonuclease subunit S [Saccharospirillum alexandrii]
MKARSTLGELAEDITVGFVGSMATEYVAEGIPFLRSLNVKPYSYEPSDLKYISQKFHKKIRKSALSPGDVVAVRTGNPGASCVIPETLPEANCSDLVVIRCGELLDPHFVSYYINSVTHSHVKNQLVGAIQKHFNIGSAKDLPFPDLNKTQQAEISSVLRVIDKKIELNNRINTKLEAMAKTLYDYWFVQFDFPDANGNPYKTSGGKMVYNQTLKREIPEGWSDKTLSQIANITMGQSPEGSSYNEVGVGTIFYQGSTDFGWLFPTTRQYTTAPSRMAKKGDILLSVRAPVGDMNIANSDCCIGRGLAALNSKTGSDGFLFYVMKYFKQIFNRRNSEGTTFGSITKNDLHSLTLAYPTADLLKKYDDVVTNYNKMIFERSLENRELISLRDWLLPMLMNGQVIVK